MAFLDPILSPFLLIDPKYSIPLLSLILSFLITLAYKYTTNQKLIGELKKKMKELQKETRGIKEPDKLMAKNKEIMDINMKLMSQTMKSTLYTFLPLIIIFAWLSAHFTYMPIQPNSDFNVLVEGATNVTFSTKGDIQYINQTVENGIVNATFHATKPGNYLIIAKADGKEYLKKVTVSDHFGYYEEATKKYGDVKITVVMDRLHPYGDFKVPLFNWRPGWLGTYILTSILFSSLLRKLLKVQ